DRLKRSKESQAQSRYLADHISQASMRLIPGADGAFYTDHANEMLDEIEEFLTGTRPAVEIDRLLTTIVFTDLVNSTRKQAELGDARWHELLDRHDDLVGRELQRYNGDRVKFTGDGVLARFDGPARAVRCTQSILSGLA